MAPAFDTFDLLRSLPCHFQFVKYTMVPLVTFRAEQPVLRFCGLAENQTNTAAGRLLVLLQPLFPPFVVQIVFLDVACSTKQQQIFHHLPSDPLVRPMMDL